MSVLLTRPLEDSKLLSLKLNEINIPNLIEPMFQVKYLKNDELDETIENKNIIGIIFTSKNTIAALLQSTQPSPTRGEGIKIFVVGQETYNSARSAGFSNIHAADNNVNSLIHLIKKECANSKGILLYPRGELITTDLKVSLNLDNVKIQEFIVYKTIATKHFSKELISQIKNSEINIVVLYSKNTAAIFFKLLKQSKVEKYLKDAKILVMSDEIKSFISELTSNEVKVFKNTDNLITMIREKHERF